MVSIMNLYENVIIGRQDLTQQQMDALVVGLNLYVTQNGGEVVRSEYCGPRNLCYPIKKNHKGHYYIMQIKIDPKYVKELERIMGLNEDIIRFLLVKVDFFETRDNLITQSRFTNEHSVTSQRGKDIKDTGYRNKNAITTEEKGEDIAPEQDEVIQEIEE